jgi:hypothetical protein
MASVTGDFSAIKDVLTALKNANSEGLQVGWFSSANYDDGVPVAGVAALQEFGNDKIPPRPFFRPAIEDNKQDWVSLVGEGATAMLAGDVTMNDVLDGLGLAVQGDVKQAIIDGDHATLSDSTIKARRAKGNTNTDPLRDTGIMLATLTYEVTS